MRQISVNQKPSSERIGKTFGEQPASKQYSAEEKIRIVLLKGKEITRPLPA